MIYNKKIVIFKNNMNKFRLIFSFIVFFILGIFIINTPYEFLPNVVMLVSIGLFINGFSGILAYLFSKRTNDESKYNKNQIKYLKISDGTKIINNIINILLAILFFYKQNIGKWILLFGFYFYLCLNAVAKLTVYLLYRKNGVKKRFSVFFEFFIFVLFNVLFLFSPYVHIYDIIIWLGSYCIVYSFTYFFDFLREILPIKTKNKFKRSIRISAPSLFTALIPYKTLQKVNMYINNTGEPDDIPDYEESQSDEEPDLEVFIHVTEDGFGRIGHMDLWYNGEFISYGNYDDSSLRYLETMGDGVLFFTSNKNYIPFCIKQSKKTLFSFGLKLSKEEKKRIDTEILSIKSTIKRWFCPLEEAIMSKKDFDKSSFTDYASLLYDETGAKFYKFDRGRFKTYFVLGTNCSLLADTLIGRLGTDIIKMSGVISPGAYFDFLNREYYKKGTKVIKKRIYN